MSIVLVVPALVTNRAFAIDATGYQVKVAYLFKFTQFIDWPAAAFDAPASSLHLCILDEDEKEERH